jgi:hypothetical protein
MHFHNLDLNLLVALDTLLDERNVSRAAERLHLTQSAMSNALSRLREFFGDALLVPVGRHMEPTALALNRHGQTARSSPHKSLGHTPFDIDVSGARVRKMMTGRRVERGSL